MTLAEAAQKYAEKLKWFIFPVFGMTEGRCDCGVAGCGSPGKHPNSRLVQHGVKDASRTPEIVAAWWKQEPNSNIGLACGPSGVLVVDVDGPEGEVSLRELEATWGALPETMEAITGRGAHLVFANNGEMLGNSSGRLGPKLDTRGDGGYIVLTPSVHHSGKSYAWKRTAPRAPLPGTLRELLTARPAPRPLTLVPAMISRSDAMRRAALYLAPIPGAVSGEAGHSTTWNVALKVVAGFDLTDDEAFSILASEYNPKCVPPWSEKELRHKISDAAKSTAERGFLLNKPLERSMSTSAVAAPTEWSEPVEITRKALLAFDAALLPAALRAWVADEAERSSAPAAFVAVSAIVAASTILGRGIRIRCKRHDSWSEPALLWGLLVAESGVGKSPALSRGTYFMRKAHATQSAADAEVMRGWQDRMAEAKKSRRTFTEDRPVLGRQLITNDATIEGLRVPLIESPEGILLLRDELSGWLAGLDKEGREGERQFFLEAWNGTGEYTYNRVGAGKMFLKSFALGVLGGAQPAIAEMLATGTEDGLLPRFNLMVTAEEGVVAEVVDRPTDMHALQAAEFAFERLLKLDSKKIEASKGGFGVPVLQFDDAAQDLFLAWFSSYRKKNAELGGPLKQHLSKYQNAVPRLALTFHMLDAPDVYRPGKVGIGALRRALDWLPFLESHARAVYQVRESASAFELAGKLRVGKVGDLFSSNEVANHGWRALASAPQVTTAAESLVELGWLRVIEQPTSPKGGRPCRRYQVNPAILAQQGAA